MNHDDLDTLAGPALRDRMRDEFPDLERLAEGSLLAGTRLRRRRRAGMVLGGAAAVAGIGIGGALLGSGGGTSTATEPTPAAAPTSASSPAPAPAGLAEGQVLDLGAGLNATITADSAGLHKLGTSMAPGPGTGFTAVVTGPTPAIETWWSGGFGTLTADWPGIAIAVRTPVAEALGMLGKVDRAPVTVGADWTCEWYLVDDKAACTAPDGGVASLVIRDAADRAAWLSSTDKGADPTVFTTEAHDGIFISVQAGLGTTAAEVSELGDSLAWVD